MRMTRQTVSCWTARICHCTAGRRVRGTGWRRAHSGSLRELDRSSARPDRRRRREFFSDEGCGELGYRLIRLGGVRVVDPGRASGGTAHKIRVVYGSETSAAWREIREAVVISCFCKLPVADYHGEPGVVAAPSGSIAAARACGGGGGSFGRTMELSCAGERACYGRTCTARDGSPVCRKASGAVVRAAAPVRRRCGTRAENGSVGDQVLPAADDDAQAKCGRVRGGGSASTHGLSSVWRGR